MLGIVGVLFAPLYETEHSVIVLPATKSILGYSISPRSEHHILQPRLYIHLEQARSLPKQNRREKGNQRMSSQDITLVHLTPLEVSREQISSHNLQAAIQALHRDGIAVLTNAINPEHLDRLNARMVPEAKILYAKATTQRNFGANTGNIQQEPPIDTPELLFSDVVANKFAASVIECIMGPNPTLRFFSANTAFKAEARQPPHIDVAFEYPDIPFGFAVNVNLVDTSPENGATEVWPGSHLVPEINNMKFVDNNYHVPKSHQQHNQNGENANGEDGAGGSSSSSSSRNQGGQKPRVKMDSAIIAARKTIFDTGFSEDVRVVREPALEARRAIRPPIQPSLPKGSVIIRDLRLWHAGLPNKTDDPRVMLVMVLFPSWYRSEARIELPEIVKGKIDWGNIVPCVNWLKEGYGYLKGECNADFDLLP